MDVWRNAEGLMASGARRAIGERFSPVGVTGFLATSHGLFSTLVRDRSIYPFTGPLEPCSRVSDKTTQVLVCIMLLLMAFV